MHALLIVLRLIHVGMGAIWVGSAVLIAFFVAPAVGDVGPDGGKVMGALQRRGLMTFMPTLGILTILSGIWLYWHDSAGFQPEFSRSPMGMAYGFGGLLALIVMVMGILVLKPTMLRLAALGQSIGAAAPAERETIAAEMRQLQTKGATVNRLGAGLLVLAVAAMAVARYL